MKEVDLLKNTGKNILPSFESSPNSWTREILDKQADVLSQILIKEKEIIGLMEEELIH